MTANHTTLPAPGAGAEPGGARPLRADAAKNRARILRAAEEVFAHDGVAVPIDLVAERAGVGVGTLYRHFPTKEALFEAIVMARLERLLESASAYAKAGDPGAALFSFIEEFAGEAAAKRDLYEALGSAGIDIKSRCAEMVEEMKRNVGTLLQRAATAGAVRGDVSSEEMISLVVGACHAAGQSGVGAVSLERMVGIVCDGLRPRSPASS